MDLQTRPVEKSLGGGGKIRARQMGLKKFLHRVNATKNVSIAKLPTRWSGRKKPGSKRSPPLLPPLF